MSLSADKITKWSKRGDALRAWYSYHMVRDTLAGAKLNDLDYGIYPQGSYANKTNIVTDSDVDLVIALRSSFYPNKENLSPAEIEEYARYYAESDLTWHHFREAVVKVLRKNFWVHEHSKCVKVSSSLVRLPADVLIALDYRYYTSFPSFFSQEFTGGVQFYTSAGTEIVNYPKRHIKSCAEKNFCTFGHYRPIVRVAKNARNALAAEDGSPVEAGTVPSYFLESLLWNVPKGRYEGKLVESYCHVVGWLYENRGNLEGMMFPNKMGKLFGDGADAVWDKNSAKTFIEALYHQLNS